jgi:hypothetical protein
MALGAYCYTERHPQGWAQDAVQEVIEGARLASRAVEFGKSDGNVLWMSAHAIWNLPMDTPRGRGVRQSFARD